MLLALECPTELIPEIQPLADYDFALTHLILSDERYAEYYANSKRTKILDNSTNELLHPLSPTEVKRAADMISPDYVVAPDYLGDYKSTLESLVATCHMFPHDKIIPVIQGSSLQEAISCLKGIVSMSFSRLAVPFDILTNRKDKPSLEEMAKNRRMVIRMIDNSFPQYPIDSIHLLGVTTLEELRDYDTYPAVETVDTGSPILHGLNGLRFGRDRLLPKDTPTMNQMPGSERYTVPMALRDIFWNIAYLRKYTSGGN